MKRYIKSSSSGNDEIIMTSTNGTFELHKISEALSSLQIYTRYDIKGIDTYVELAIKARHKEISEDEAFAEPYGIAMHWPEDDYVSEKEVDQFVHQMQEALEFKKACLEYFKNDIA